jgi:endonuclease/exonuclease/phosphatase family metal-dependent hydrolase
MHKNYSYCTAGLCGLLLLMLAGLAPFQGQAQNNTGNGKAAFTLVFYNTENFYDTIDDPSVNDAEYLPSSENKWNSEKYAIKVAQIGKVLCATDSVKLPAIIGLTEIENRQVLEDLIKNTGLKKGKYNIIHEESRDPRGIDVALLYRPDAFRELNHHKIPVYYDGSDKSTRECLYVCGILGRSDTLHLIINHWKSRTGGTEKTKDKRNMYALSIRKVVDSVFAKNVNANIILMGDFNDTPADSSVRYVLGALPCNEAQKPAALYNLSSCAADRGEGSHYYKSWEMFDQMMVSSMLRSNKKIQCDAETTVFKRDWMCYKNSRGSMVPNRTFSGGQYYGGFSDHLPVLIHLYATQK